MRPRETGRSRNGYAIICVCTQIRRVDQPLADQVDDQLVELAVEIFTMLADATRVRIVLALKDGELSVNTLADVVGKSPAAVSQHLAKLRLARIVTTRHEGNRVFYRLANEHALELVTDAMFQAEHSLDDQPRHHRRHSRKVTVNGPNPHVGGHWHNHAPELGRACPPGRSDRPA